MFECRFCGKDVITECCCNQTEEVRCIWNKGVRVNIKRRKCNDKDILRSR